MKVVASQCFFLALVISYFGTMPHPLRLELKEGENNNSKLTDIHSDLSTKEVDQTDSFGEKVLHSIHLDGKSIPLSVSNKKRRRYRRGMGYRT